MAAAGVWRWNLRLSLIRASREFAEITRLCSRSSQRDGHKLTQSTMRGPPFHAHTNVTTSFSGPWCCLRCVAARQHRSDHRTGKFTCNEAGKIDRTNAWKRVGQRPSDRIGRIGKRHALSRWARICVRSAVRTAPLLGPRFPNEPSCAGPPDRARLTRSVVANRKNEIHHRGVSLREHLPTLGTKIVYRIVHAPAKN